MKIPPTQAAYKFRGNVIVTPFRPQNPKDDTLWIEPGTNQISKWDSTRGTWVDVFGAGGGFIVPISQGGTGASTAAGARTNLGLGTLSTQNADDPNLNGRIRLGKVTSTSANYSFSTTDTNILATGGAGGITVTLPSANLAGQIVRVWKVDGAAGAVTVSRTGSDTIQGATTFTLSIQYNSIELLSDGSGTWYIISTL